MARGSRAPTLVSKRRADYAACFTRFAILAIVARLQPVAAWIELQGLIGGSADVAGKVQIHEMAMSKGVMKMHPLETGLVIEPGKTVKLAPGGYHVMLMDLKSQLKQGDKLPITLEFEKAGKVTVSFDVGGVGAQGPADASGMGGKMDMKKMPDHPGMKM
jgi:hypothetical protein